MKPLNISKAKFALANLGNKKIVVSGGSSKTVVDGCGNTRTAYSESVHAYDIDCDRWELLPCLNIARSSHSSTVLAACKQVYVFGGYAEGKHLDSIEVLHFGEDAWQPIKVEAFTARGSAIIAAISEREIIILGGQFRDIEHDGQWHYLSDVVIFDAKERIAWRVNANTGL